MLGLGPSTSPPNEVNKLTKYECLNCIHLDIDYDEKALCTGCYDTDAIKKSINGQPCEYYRGEIK